METSRVLGFLRYDVTNLAYAMPNLKTGAVIGVGGGRDVLSRGMTALSVLFRQFDSSAERLCFAWDCAVSFGSEASPARFSA